MKVKSFYRKNQKQVQQSSEDFGKKNRQVIEQILMVNNEVRRFAVHLSQNCEVSSNGETVDVSQQLDMIVKHMDQMDFVFNSIKELK